MACVEEAFDHRIVEMSQRTAPGLSCSATLGPVFSASPTLDL